VHLEKLVEYIEDSGIEVEFEFFRSDFFPGKYSEYSPTLNTVISFLSEAGFNNDDCYLGNDSSYCGDCFLREVCSGKK